MKESIFTGNPEDPRFSPINKLKDMQNSVGRQFNPDKDEYWDLMRKKMETFTGDELKHLNDRIESLGENKDRIGKIIKSIEVRRAEGKRTKLDEVKRVFEGQTS